MIKTEHGTNIGKVGTQTNLLDLQKDHFIS